jgi:hypothetical protein
MQQVVALFVLKSGAGRAIFGWIATAASDFLAQGPAAAQFFFDADVISKHWFFVNVLSSIIFFIAFVQMMYYVSNSYGIGNALLTHDLVDWSHAVDDRQICLVLLQDYGRLWS